MQIESIAWLGALSMALMCIITPSYFAIKEYIHERKCSKRNKPLFDKISELESKLQNYTEVTS